MQFAYRFLQNTLSLEEYLPERELRKATKPLAVITNEKHASK